MAVKPLQGRQPRVDPDITLHIEMNTIPGDGAGIPPPLEPTNGSEGLPPDEMYCAYWIYQRLCVCVIYNADPLREVSIHADQFIVCGCFLGRECLFESRA